MAETVVYTPENTQANMLPWLMAGNNGFGGWGGGLATGGIGFLLGLLFGNGTFGNAFGGGMGNGAGFISNQIDNNAGRELLMNAINSQGEAGRAATQNLATMLGQDFNLVNANVQAIQAALNALSVQQAVSVPQIINSIQSGNSALASQLCESCCNMRQLVTSQGYENQLATLNQTNHLGTAITNSGQHTVDAIADLKTTMVQEFCAAKERDMQDKIDSLIATNSTLRTQIDNAAQTAQITGYINALVSPIQKDVDDIKCKQPSTATVTWPNLQAVNVTPYVSGGYYQGGYNGFYGSPGIGGFGNGFLF